MALPKKESQSNRTGFFSFGHSVGIYPLSSAISSIIFGFIDQTSIFRATNALLSIKFRRGSTSSPIRVVKI
ncbi:hypothetical protein CMPELA_00020 [Cupriavidus necator]